MSKVFKYGIITVAMAVGLLAGPKACTKYEKKKAEYNSAKQEQQDQQRVLAEQDAKYEEYIIDSVLTSKGFTQADKNLYGQSFDFENQMFELSWKNSPGGALENAVFTAAEQIIKRNMDVLSMDLIKYGIEIANVIDITNDMCANPEIIMCGAYKDANIEDNYNAQDFFVSQIVKNINMDCYGEIRQEEIVEIVNNDFSQMFSELYTSRKKIEKSFADYFAGGQQCLNDYAVSYCGEGEVVAGYDKERIFYPYRLTTRMVKVYDSKLPVEFFGDKDAGYTLEQVAKGQWRVVKKFKNGKIAKTPVFQHDIDYTVSTYGSNSDKIDRSFDFYPGTNMGVHVMVNEVIDVQKAKKQFKTSPAVNKKIDSLAFKRDSVLKREKEYLNAQIMADSIAQVKLKQRAALRARSK